MNIEKCKKMLGLYIHIPFCKKKCDYCDFISFANRNNMIEKYINAVKCEINSYSNYKEEYEIKTIYFGGGTPSYIESKYIVDILNNIKNKFTVLKNAEITIEINPGTVDRKKLEDYIGSGINRVSFGLQSVDDKLLKNIGRIHNFEDFLYSYNLAKEVGFKNINVDLMIGLPTQNIQDIEKSLNKLIELSPEHISVYSLILEEGTPLEIKVKNKELYIPSDVQERNMYWKVKEELEKNGYIHYEISNFSKIGYESKHNVSCWKQEEYIGIGVAAHSYINNKRYSNTDNLEEYIKNSEDNINEIREIHEVQNKKDKMNEYMILGLRKIQGIKISEFKNKFIDNPIYIYREQLNRLATQGLIIIDEDNIRLTNKGIDLANLVWEEFI